MNMFKKLLWIAAIIPAFMFICNVSSVPAYASYTVGQYGEDCGANGSGCGIGNDIVLSSIQCYILNNNNPNDASIPCKTSLAAYGTLPTTYDPTQIVFKFTTLHPSYGEVRGGALGVVQVIWDDTTVSTTHTVIVNHIVPTQNVVPVYEIGACQHAFPCNNADGTWSVYPGPTNTAGTAAYFKIITPAPPAVLPVSFEINELGHLPAWQGSPTMIPLMSIMKAGSFQTLPPTATVNNVALQGTVPNGIGAWHYWNGSSWVTTIPQWYLTTLTITIGSTTYICHPDAAGNHNSSTGAVENTCVSGGSDSGSALIVYYNGIFGTQAQDYRPINFDSSVGQYFVNVPDVTVPPGGSSSVSMTLEFYSGSTAITGNATANLTFTLYTGANGHIAAAPATSISLNLPVNVQPVTVLAADPPVSPTHDANLLPYERFMAQSGINMCYNTAAGHSLLNNLVTLNTGTWWSIGPAGYWNETQSWLYDQGRVYTNIQEQMTRMMNGTNWSDWTGGVAFGLTYANLTIKPSLNNTGGYFYMAMNPGTSGVSEPNWNTHTSIGATFTDGGITWMVLGNQASWEACVEYAQNPYVYAVVTNGASSTGQFSQYPAGSLKSYFTTGDTFPQDGGSKIGMYSRAVIDLACYNPGSAECSPDHAATGVGNFMSVFSDNAGRGTSRNLEDLAYYWRLQHYLGTDGNFTNDAERTRFWKTLINVQIDYLYYFVNQSNVGTVNSLDNFVVDADSFYYGIVMESLITAYDTVKYADPTNAHGLLDPRIPQAIQDFVNYAHVNFFDQPFSQQGMHTYSFGFTMHDYETVQGYNTTGGAPVGGTENGFFNELAGFFVESPSWLYDYCGNSCTGPGGIGYDAISDLWRLGNLSGYKCTAWFCTTFSDGLWLHNFTAGTGSPKNMGFAYFNGANDENWRNGYRQWSEMDLDPGRNPCRDGSNGTNPCASGHHSVFADVMPAYPMEIYGAGSTRFGQYPYNQIDPTDCPVPCSFTGGKASPVSAVGSTSMVVTEFTAEQATMSISYGTDTTCSTGLLTTENAGFPQLMHFTTSDIWEHQFTLTGLTPNTNYHMKFNTTDLANNHFSTNCGATAGGLSGGNLNVTTLPQTLLVVSAFSLPAGQTQVAYSGNINALGGTPPYTWCIKEAGGACDDGTGGALPPGLSVATDVNGVAQITGTPSTRGLYPFVAQVQDSVGNTALSTALNLSITISDLKITTTSPLPPGTLNVPYSANISTSGGVLPFTWTLQMINNPGLTLVSNGTGAILSGTPNASGSYQVVIKVTDSANPLESTSKAFVLTIGTGGSLIVTSTSPGPATIGTPYIYNLTAVGGTAPYSWSVSAGSLPHLLSIVGSQIVGTPDTSGTSSFTLEVTDANNVTATAPVSIVVSYPAVVVTSTTLPPGMPLFTYLQNLTATGGDGTYTWSQLSGIQPPGLTVNSNGTITGTPTAPGTYSFVVQATDGHSNTGSGTVTIVVETPITISSPLAMPNGIVGTPYGLSGNGVIILTLGGQSPFGCSIISGSVPGLNMSNNCIYSGIPITAGAYNITVRATDVNGFYNIPDMAYTVTVTNSLSPRTSSRGTSQIRGSVRVR